MPYPDAKDALAPRSVIAQLNGDINQLEAAIQRIKVQIDILLDATDVPTSTQAGGEADGLPPLPSQRLEN